jgi:NAD(P)-dependent dehydrogenase (short-subunit alcohol dehydrogenase family)
MLTKAAAVDFACDNIRVNCICPGAIDTPLNYPYYEAVGGRAAYEAKLVERQPLGMGSPTQIANIAVFLASDESNLITGAAIMADGGYSAL